MGIIFKKSKNKISIGCFFIKFNAIKNEDLSKHNSIRIGGNAKYFVEPKTIKEFVKIIKFCKQNDVAYYILGNGTKVVFSDNGFCGVVICTKKLKQITKRKNIVCAMCGVNLFTLNRFLIQNALAGLEFSYGIPGTVGGAMYMNAGAYGGDIGSFVQKVQVYDGKKIRVVKGKDLNFSYRKSAISQKSYVVLKVWLKLKMGNKNEIEKKCEEYFSKRKISQPLETYNFGSTFKKTNGIIAGKIIDNLGLKGVKINGAQISTLHGNFIINQNNATMQDVKDLITLVKNKVYESCGVWLEEEVIFVGDKK